VAPSIKLNALMTNAFRALATKPGPLTGNELRFLRHHMRQTLQAFAQGLRVTHQAVMKWERAEDRPTGMSWGTIASATVLERG
jgi:DNA-binding transcriptional regulator YiaG